MRSDLVTYWNLPFYRAMIERSGFGEDIDAFDAGMGAGDIDRAMAGISDDFLRNSDGDRLARRGARRRPALHRGRLYVSLHRPHPAHRLRSHARSSRSLSKAPAANAFPLQKRCRIGYRLLVTEESLQARSRSAFVAGRLNRTVSELELLRDGHGRLISDLRVSVTDRCNFRCQYCMPAEGLPWLERAQILSFEEVERLVRLFAAMGVRGRAPDRRRAARAARLSQARRDAVRNRRRARPLADHQRLPARRNGRRAGGGRASAHQRLARFALARPLLPDDSSRRSSTCHRRARGARALPPDRSGQGQLRGDARFHRGRGDPVRRALPAASRTRCASSSSCRWTPTTPGRPTAS